ncbi:unnamed protein product [Linum tenue]|uniref:Uncharacterized protein n=1 Tax=Linum tenue TaxID=586396 RepID=A0AAV0J7G7_9ROSI|nr:unnamed protein product [Linum tenue]
MVTATARPAVTGVRMSSVVPASVTGENEDRRLTGLDLAMKLHYIKAVYFFDEKAAEGLTIYDMKKPMFPWLQLYHPAAGRIRRGTKSGGEGRGEEGRPFIKCNDGGVRIVEAYCPDWTVEEWLRLPTAEEDRDGGFRDDDWLAFDQVLGPDLGFSPLVYVQFTWFKCGGLSVGLSWAHLLGDPFSACAFINTWAQLLHGRVTPLSLHHPGFKDPSPPPLHRPKKNPSSLKRVDPVADSWRPTSNPNAATTRTHTFRLTAQQLNDLASAATSASTAKISRFDLLAAILWKSVAKIREATTVTICWNKSPAAAGRERELPSNKMAVGAVHADFAVAKCEVSELAELIAERKEDESDSIEEAMSGGEFDCVVYGANLTFVNLEEAPIYEMQVKKGRKPVFANCKIEGVGEEGAVLVLPGGGGEKEGEGSGKTVTVMLPAKQLAGLKEDLRKSWGIV